MLFNSIEFILFLSVIFILYWLSKGKTQLQNIIILIGSYIFYGAWDWRFLFLIFFSSLIDYTIGLLIFNSSNKSNRKLYLFISILVNIGMLGVFKYFNFFIESLIDITNAIGIHTNYHSLQIILPVGISFYTFQTLSYSIDIYKNKLSPTKDPIAFFSFVSFFPQLVAGPIERASNLLPQFLKKRKFNYNYAVTGLKLILWGLFKKVVIADNCAEVANYTFANYANLEGSLLFFGLICFAFQIYGDFSGYSDIAIGTARLLGFNLMRNFAFPYFSRNIKEFWQRWHISLSTWFRDYVYIPLGGSRVSLFKRIRNILITFIVSGFWHGANWTFIIWGAIHGALYVPEMVLSRFVAIPKVKNKVLNYFTNLLKGIGTFLIVCLAWVFFRADSLSEAIIYIDRMLKPSLFKWHKYDDRVLLFLIPFVLLEWINRNKELVLDFNIPIRSLRWLMYLIISLFVFNNWGKEIQFIYFQF